MKYAEIDEQEAFLSSNQKYLNIKFPEINVEINNDDIVGESLQIIDTLCDTNQIQFGKCSAKSFIIKIFNDANTYKGKICNVSVTCGEYTRQLGTYKIEEETKSADRSYKTLKGYDSISDLAEIDATNWFNSLSFPITFKAMRNSFFDFIGYSSFEDINLPCDIITLPKRTTEAKSITALDVMQGICELNGCFGHIDFDNVFRFVHFRTTDDGLYPRNDLYPSDDLFPTDIIDFTLNKSDFYMGSLTYEDYTCKPITQVQIREDDSDQGVVVGEEGNTYIIQNNVFCQGLSADVLRSIATAFLRDTKYIPYNVLKVQTRCKPWVEVGDFVRVIGNDILYTPILKRTIKGINAIKDTYESSGNEYFESDMNNISRKIEALDGRTTRIESDVDGVRSEVQRIDGDKVSTSTFTQTVNGITTEVSKKVNGTEVVSTINQSAEKVSINANKININGVVSANKNFKINTNGTVEATNGKFSGEIISSNATINGGKIDINAEQTFYDVIRIKAKQMLVGLFDYDFKIRPDSINMHTEYNYTLSGTVYNAEEDAEYKANSIKLTKKDRNKGITTSSGCQYGGAGWSTSSDERIKDKIKGISDYSMKIFNEINAKEFSLKTFPDKKQFGFIAQDVESALLNVGIINNGLVNKPENETDYYSLVYEQMIPILWDVCKQQQIAIDELKAEIKSLKGEE